MDAWLSFLLEENVNINKGLTTSLGEQTGDYEGLASRDTISPLMDRGVIEITGPDTDKLLQGQLTCDMTQLPVGGSTPGALCDNKGRMIASFFAARPDQETVLLVMHGGLLESALQTLKKYAVFYKTKLVDVSDQYRVIGVGGGLTATLSIQAIRISPRLAMVPCPAAQARDTWTTLKATHLETGMAFWEYLCIREGIGETRPQTTGEFIPQMLNLQHTGAISFRKGCYTGQEIVARMQYLGKLKRRMYRLRVESGTLMEPGTAINSSDRTAVGTVVMAQLSAPGSLEALAVLTAEAAAESQLGFAENILGITQLPLPYDDKFSGAHAGNA